MRKLICIILAVMALQACKEREAKNHNTKILADAASQTFLKRAAESNLTAIEASQLAQSQSASPRVVKFAGNIVWEHTAMDDGLQQVESVFDIPHSDSISSESQRRVAALSESSGNEFDKAYLALIIAEHREAITLFKKAGDNKVGIVSRYAKSNLPKLQAHLDTAVAISATLK